MEQRQTYEFTMHHTASGEELDGEMMETLLLLSFLTAAAVFIDLTYDHGGSILMWTFSVILSVICFLGISKLAHRIFLCPPEFASSSVGIAAAPHVQ